MERSNQQERSGVCVHLDVQFLAILVDIITPHVVAEHDQFDDGYEVHGDEPAEGGKKRAKNEIIQAIGLVLPHLIIQYSDY